MASIVATIVPSILAAPTDPMLGYKIPSPSLEIGTTGSKGLIGTSCQSKWCRVLAAAEELSDELDGLDPEIVAAICIHESGFRGQFGFGILAWAGGYANASDPTAAIKGFITLVSDTKRYEMAWDARMESEHFLQLLINAGYGTDRAWPGKVIWLRDFMIDHPEYEG